MHSYVVEYLNENEFKKIEDGKIELTDVKI